jgi:hypothetical protein
VFLTASQLYIVTCVGGDGGFLCCFHDSKVISSIKPASTILTNQPKQLPNTTEYLPNTIKHVIKELHSIKIDLR